MVLTYGECAVCLDVTFSTMDILISTYSRVVQSSTGQTDTMDTNKQRRRKTACNVRYTIERE